MGVNLIGIFPTDQDAPLIIYRYRHTIVSYAYALRVAWSRLSGPPHTTCPPGPANFSKREATLKRNPIVLRNTRRNRVSVLRLFCAFACHRVHWCGAHMIIIIIYLLENTCKRSRDKRSPR